MVALGFLARASAADSECTVGPVDLVEPSGTLEVISSSGLGDRECNWNIRPQLPDG